MFFVLSPKKLQRFRWNFVQHKHHFQICCH